MSTAMTRNQSTAITPASEQAIQYRVALNANLFGMPDAEVYTYYRLMCQHLKLDPTSHPFDIINDAKASQKKLYLNSIGTSQLGDRAKLSYSKLDIDVNEKLVSLGFKVAHVSIEVRHPDGRSLVAEAFVDLMSGWSEKGAPSEPLKGNNLINALKKAGTQCRRRGTLQMLGMMPQDAEVPTITLGSLERDDEYEGVTVEQPPDAALLEAPKDETAQPVTSEAVEMSERDQTLASVKELLESVSAVEAKSQLAALGAEKVTALDDIKLAEYKTGLELAIKNGRTKK